MIIKKVNLPQGSLRGAEITHLKRDMKNNRPFTHEIIEKRKNPISMDMEQIFKDLRSHLLDINNILNIRLSEAEATSVILDTEVDTIEFDGDGFILSGKMEVFGDKYVKLKTPKVQESDNYEGFKNVIDLFKSLCVESIAYMDGLKVASDREMTLRWIESKKDPEMTKEIFEAMSPEEQKEYTYKKVKFGDASISEEEEEDDDDLVEGAIIIPPDAEVIEIVAKEKKGKSVKTETGAF